jgi:FG-GAP-like repeat
MTGSRLLRFAVLLAFTPAFAQVQPTLGPALSLDAWGPGLSYATPRAKSVTILNPMATGSKTAVRNNYNTYFAPAMPAMGFTGNIGSGSCIPGTISTAFKEFTISRVNYYRAMVGLPGNVALDTNATFESEQQSAAVLFASNNMLSHAPANPPFTICTGLIPAASNAAGHSNIGLASGSSSLDDAVPLYMDDSGTGNELAGHRRWFLFPPQAAMTFGASPAGPGPGGNAIRVFDGWGATRPATPNGVAWPPAGFVPTQVLPASNRWSYSFNSASGSSTFPGNNADFTGANVTMTANGSSIGVTVISRASSSCPCTGDSTIVFVPTPAIVAGTNYTVNVTGITGVGAPSSVTYTVRPFNATATIPGVNGDFNGNGMSDLLFQNTDGRQAIWLMNGAALTSSAEIIGAGSGWSVTQIADLNGDGKSDLVWQHTDGRIALYLMNGTTPTSTLQILNAGTGWSVTHTPDLNGDGKADLLFQNTDGSVAVWTMNGTSMIAGATIMGPGTGWSVVKTADFDGDGNDDLLWKHTDGRVAIWLMNGINVKATGQILNAASGWSAIQTPDLNGDGKADIVWQHTDGSIAVWLMNGTTVASGSGILGAGSGWSVTRTGDFDGDGRADLFFLHTDGRAAIWLMNGITPTATAQILNAGGGWSAKRLVDLNGDGKADIVWQNTDGRVAVWLMSGTTMTSGTGILGTGTGWSVSAVSQ